ncbi:Matrin-type domain-containing protein [Aphelenchoides bicaudatus]|nr:Matrin-type domain-containing protein [Aphelenchoides bicaudatus]
MKYYCDYCDAFLTHDSPSVRKTHNGGRKHKENVRMFYQTWMEQQAQKLVDATARAFTQNRLLMNAGQPAMPAGIPMPGRPMLPHPGMRMPIFPYGMPQMPRPGMPPMVPGMNPHAAALAMAGRLPRPPQ